jgi:ATP-binding cassette subfamily A (ABC1) protein 3
MNSAILKTAVNSEDAYIQAKFRPLPVKADPEVMREFMMYVFLISLAYNFIPCYTIMFIVIERKNFVKLQQRVSGVSIYSYWCSNFVIDYAIFLFVSFFTFIFFWVFKAELYLGADRISMNICLHLAFGISIISMTYLSSLRFRMPSKAQVLIYLLCFISGFILIIIGMNLKRSESTKSFQLNVLEWIFRIFPTYSMFNGMYSISTPFWTKIYYDLEEEPEVWSKYVALYELVYLIVTSLVFIVLLFVTESKREKNIENLNPSKVEELVERVQEEDVIKEMNEVKSRNDLAVKVQDLTKVFEVFDDGGCFKKGRETFRRVKAVKGISFGIEKGDCFGLLGAKGAGKSTTFKMLNGELQPSFGVAKINNLNVATDMKKIRHQIGYCPQTDPLLDNLTAREHLELYAAVKGIPEDMWDSLIDDAIEKLNLTEFENIPAGAYSGGRKQKEVISCHSFAWKPISCNP